MYKSKVDLGKSHEADGARPRRRGTPSHDLTCWRIRPWPKLYGVIDEPVLLFIIIRVTGFGGLGALHGARLALRQSPQLTSCDRSFMGSFLLDSHRSPVFRLAESPSCIYTRHPAFPTSSLLTSSWSFSAIYPLHQTTVSFGESKIPAQSLTWAIEAEPDGRLVKKTASVEAQATLFISRKAKSRVI